MGRCCKRRRAGSQSDPEEVKGETDHPDRLLYNIDENPPWYLCIIFGMQHYLNLLTPVFTRTLIVTTPMCIADDEVGKSEVIATTMFMSGIATLLQCTLGSRLPIVQCVSTNFLLPVFAILALPQWKCPDMPELFTKDGNASYFSRTAFVNASGSFVPYVDWRRSVWTTRMREIQGAIIVGSLAQLLYGLTGLVGFLMKFIGPLTVAPTIFLIAFSLSNVATDLACKHWGVAIFTAALVFLFGQYLRKVSVPCLRPSRDGCVRTKKMPIFTAVPVIMAVVISWFLCYVLTVTGALGAQPGTANYFARTDIKASVLQDAPWFIFPYPGQWGWPTLSAGAVIGMASASFGNTVESIGDYYACARLSGAPAPPVHAVNRGIFVEAIGCLISGLLGTGTGTTSFTSNIAILGLTRVASRRMIQMAGIIMIVLSVFGKSGALFVTIPEPVFGGVMMVVLGLVAALAVSNLQYTDLSSTRNLTIFGFSIYFGFCVPTWIRANPGAINTGSVMMDQIFTILCSNAMFVGGGLGFILDNTVPGTIEERGLATWREDLKMGKVKVDPVTDPRAVTMATYDLPLGMSVIRRIPLGRYIPICPMFTAQSSSCRRKHRRYGVEEAPPAPSNDEPVNQDGIDLERARWLPAHT